MNCPICEKAGLLDNIIICPQCNSDLSGLLLLNEIEHKYNQYEKSEKQNTIKLSIISKQKRLFVFFVIFILCVFSIVFVFHTTNTRQKINSIQSYMNFKNDSLQRINNSQNKIIQERSQSKISVNSTSINYCIRKGQLFSEKKTALKTSKLQVV